MSSKAMSLKATAEHRGSTERIADRAGIIGTISGSRELQNMWKKYQQKFPYAEKIAYTDTINALRELIL